MSNLKEIIESTQEDEILIICKKLDYECALSYAHGSCKINNEYITPSFEEDFCYQRSKLSDLSERKLDDHITYLKMATIKANRSYCKRRQVGALIVKNSNIIAEGYNGTPSGFENNCEDCNGETRWYVQHAEANAILKVAKSTYSSEGSTLYNTLSPCQDCSKMILGCGITHVFFNKIYKTFDGIKLLIEAGVKIYYIPKKLL